MLYRGCRRASVNSRSATASKADTPDLTYPVTSSCPQLKLTGELEVAPKSSRIPREPSSVSSIGNRRTGLQPIYIFRTSRGLYRPCPGTLPGTNAHPRDAAVFPELW